MSKPATPGWPEAGAFPFMPFPLPGSTASPTPTSMPLSGLSGGVDLIRDFWSRMPGSAAMPGFLLPTVDVDELDKRIGDLKAAERWVEVNLNMLRATIQGLEVQRHTIAAIQSLMTPTDAAKTAAPPPASGLPPGWPSPPKTGSEASTPVATAESTPGSSPSEAPAAPAAPAANDWLAYLQAQFTKVAQAAMPPPSTAPSSRDAAPRRKSAKTAAKTAVKPAAKTVAKKSAQVAARKPGEAS